MHKLFGDATDIDASTTQTPGGAHRCGYDEVDESNLSAWLCRFLQVIKKDPILIKSLSNL